MYIIPAALCAFPAAVVPIGGDGRQRLIDGADTLESAKGDEIHCGYR